MTQISSLLKLDAEVQEMVVRLGDPLSPSVVTERKLRGLSSLSVRQQTRKLEILLSSQ